MKYSVIVTWTKPDNGLSIGGGIVFETTVNSIDALIPGDGPLHDDFADAIGDTTIAAEVCDDIENGDYEYDSLIYGKTQVAMLAISTHTLTLVMIPAECIG